MASSSGFWGTYALLVDKSSGEKMLNKLMRRRYMRAHKELLLTLTGVAVSGTPTAADTYERVGHPSTPVAVGNLGGSRDIEVRTIINRATAAADVTALNAVLTDKNRPTNWPRDLSGNGGPAY